jgi:hypothetical protein
MDALVRLYENSNLFNPNKSFFQLWVVRLTVVGVVGVAYWVYDLIMENGNYIECYTSACFNESVTTFKVPLGILSLLIPIIAVYAANHRSEQTKKQIELAREQNNFINYYKHLEEFEKHFEKVESSKTRVGTGLLNARKIHGAFFPDGINGHLHIIHSINSLLNESYQAVINVLEGLKELELQSDNLNTREQIYNLCEALLYQARHINSAFQLDLHVPREEDLQKHWQIIKEDLNTVQFGQRIIDLKEFLSPFSTFAEIYNDVSDFIPVEHEVSESLVEFQHYNFNLGAKLYCSEAQPFNIVRHVET